MSGLERVTGRPSYSGPAAEELRASARITAGVYGRAYILCTVGVPERRAGGRCFVSTETDPAWPGGPYAMLEEVTR